MFPQSESINPNSKKDNGSFDLWKNKFLGTYLGTWKCDAPQQKEMTVTVSNQEGDNVSLLLTFSDGSHQLIAKINSKNIFRIEPQPYKSEMGLGTVSGVGVLNTNSTITFECKYEFNGMEIAPCMFNGSK